MNLCVYTVRKNNDGTSTYNSDQKLYFTPETSRARMSPPFIYHQLQLYSPIQDITILELPPSIFDAGCLSWHSNTLQVADSAPLSPTTPAHVEHVPHFLPPSSLQSPLDDVPELCLPPSLSQEREKKAAQDLPMELDRWQFATALGDSLLLSNPQNWLSFVNGSFGLVKFASFCFLVYIFRFLMRMTCAPRSRNVKQQYSYSVLPLCHITYVVCWCAHYQFSLRITLF